MSKKKKSEKKEEKTTDRLPLEIKINEFGEVVSNVSVDQLNDYLDERVNDKKLKK